MMRMCVCVEWNATRSEPCRTVPSGCPTFSQQLTSGRLEVSQAATTSHIRRLPVRGSSPHRSVSASSTCQIAQPPRQCFLLAYRPISNDMLHVIRPLFVIRVDCNLLWSVMSKIFFVKWLMDKKYSSNSSVMWRLSTEFTSHVHNCRFELPQKITNQASPCVCVNSEDIDFYHIQWHLSYSCILPIPVRAHMGLFH